MTQKSSTFQSLRVIAFSALLGPWRDGVFMGRQLATVSWLQP